MGESAVVGECLLQERGGVATTNCQMSQSSWVLNPLTLLVRGDLMATQSSAERVHHNQKGSTPHQATGLLPCKYTSYESRSIQGHCFNKENKQHLNTIS